MPQGTPTQSCFGDLPRLGTLGDEIIAAALIDRLLHHCHIVNIRGNSYRMREHQALLRPGSEESREGDRS